MQRARNTSTGTPTALAAWLTAASLLLAAGAAQAEARSSARRSELLTPAGWESSARELATATRAPRAEDELLIPAGWDDTRAAISGSSRGSAVCSELVVPADWSQPRIR
jgi:hypothetical protein